MTTLRTALAATALLHAFGVAAQEPRTNLLPLVDTFAEPVLVGMKLALEKNYRQGKVGIVQYQCIQGIKSSALRDPVYELLTRSLSNDELQDAQQFYGSETGQKYAKYGVLQIYPSVGVAQPEPEPSFTSGDESALASFAARPAGRKLIFEQVLQQASARQLLALTVNRLVRECLSAQ